MADGKVYTGTFFAKNDAYRKHPVINKNLSRSLPGLGIAVVVFSVYLFGDGMRTKLSASTSKKHDH